MDFAVLKSNFKHKKVSVALIYNAKYWCKGYVCALLFLDDKGKSGQSFLKYTYSMICYPECMLPQKFFLWKPLVTDQL